MSPSPRVCFICNPMQSFGARAALTGLTITVQKVRVRWFTSPRGQWTSSKRGQTTRGNPASPWARGRCADSRLLEGGAGGATSGSVMERGWGQNGEERWWSSIRHAERLSRVIRKGNVLLSFLILWVCICVRERRMCYVLKKRERIVYFCFSKIFSVIIKKFTWRKWSEWCWTSFTVSKSGRRRSGEPFSSLKKFSLFYFWLLF